MGRQAFDNFGIAAERADNYIIAASRYLHQVEQEKNIVPDIVNKLKITAKDVCLDIGCGTGNIAIPLSIVSKKIIGIDHHKCIDKLRKRISGIKNIFLISGNFLDINIKKSFDKIIVYSVLQYLSDKNELFRFIDKAIDLLKPNGKLLLGDLPNSSKEKRFFDSRTGKKYQKKWDKERQKFKKRAEGGDECIGDLLYGISKDSKYVAINDDLVLTILAHTRGKGFDAYVLPQPKELPFGYSREDIIIEKPDN